MKRKKKSGSSSSMSEILGFIDIAFGFRLRLSMANLGRHRVLEVVLVLAVDTQWHRSRRRILSTVDLGGGA
jgi:hypothetical protein